MMTRDRSRTWAVVLAGGDGTRLATLTSALHGHPVPKQFAAIESSRSMLQVTLARVERIIARERIVVVVGPAHVDLARQQVRDFDDVTLLVQPTSRGTAVAILYAVAWIRAHDPDAIVSLFPSDHYVTDEHGFITAAHRAVTASAGLGRLVVVGTSPDSADPEYGWIVPGAPTGSGTFAVERFVEKPDRVLAERLLRDGAVWNTFVLAAPASTLARLALAHLPGHAVRFDAWALGRGSIVEAFAGLESADFSRDVLQHASGLVVLTMPNVGWNDWGTPARVLASLRGKSIERELRALLARHDALAAVAHRAR